MTYVMSDIHGEYDKYIAMLGKINLKDSDTLYILGDVVDRGERPVDVLLDMMSRSNVFPILGNHEIVASKLLSKLLVEITEENHSTQIDRELMESLLMWQMDGGETTIKQFQALSVEEREYVLEYFDEFMPYEVAEIGGKAFILVHSGLGNFSPDKELDDYTLDELAFMRSDPDRRCFEDDSVFVVSGHTPTQMISGKADIYKSQNNVCIDCGATFDGGRLACLCLETMQEFYI